MILTAGLTPAWQQILLFESNEDARKRLENLLAERGFAVRAADSLAHGRTLAVRDEADLLITNLVLDDGAALDLASEWTATGRPAVGISDVFFGPTSRQLLLDQVGLSEVLETPFEDDHLLEHLQRLLPERPDTPDETDEAGGTTADMRYTLNTVNCVGACALAPVVVVDDEYHPNMTARKLEKYLKAIDQAAEAEGKEVGNA